MTSLSVVGIGLEKKDNVMFSHGAGIPASTL
jgi:hypothetical protein